MSSVLANKPGRAWRWRRCPMCTRVARASDFGTLDIGPAWEHGGFRRRCPNCGHCAPTWKFQVVREKHL
jgi:hypothetical protein